MNQKGQIALLLTLMVLPISQANAATPSDGPTYGPTSIHDLLINGRGWSNTMPAIMQDNKGWIAQDSESAHCIAGLKALDQGRWNDAVNDFDKAVAENPNNALALEYRGVARQLTICGKRDVLKVYSNPNWESSLPVQQTASNVIADYNSALKKHSNCARFFRNRAVMLSWVNNQPKQIVADCMRSIELAPNDVACLNTAAMLIAVFGNLEKSIAVLDAAVKRYPRSSLLLTNRGKLYWRAGQYDKSIQDHIASLKYEPNNIVGLRELAVSYTAARQPEKAIPVLTRAIALQPDLGDLYFIRAVAEINDKRYRATIDDATKALALHSDTPDRCYYIRGRGYFDLRQFRSALADFNKTLVFDPLNAPALKDRALINAYLGKGKQALADINASLKIDPSSSDALGIRAKLSKQFGAYDQAVLDAYSSIKQSAAYKDSLEQKPILRSFTRNTLSRDDYNTQQASSRFMQRGLSPKPEAIDKQIAKYSQIISLDDSRAEAYYNRGLLHMCKQQPQLALADFNLCLRHCDSSNSQLADSSRCLSIICTQKLGGSSDAPSSPMRRSDAKSASNYAAIAQPPQVHRPILDAVQDFLHHKLTGNDLLKLAANNHDTAVAHYYIAEAASLSGDAQTAQQNFKWVQDNADIESDEYLLANSELGYMDGDKP